jgi:hypothetical protein
MGIVSFGPLVDGVRGSIGGVTFSRGQSGNTVRAKPRPMRPRRVSQLLNQKYLSQAVHMWASVTTAQRLGWKNYAATVDLTDSLDKTYHPTSLQAYTWYVCLRLRTGQSVAAVTFPDLNGLPTLPALTFDYNAHALRITDATPDISGTETLILYVRHIDRPNNFPRANVSKTPFFMGVMPEPFTIDADYDETWPVGALARAFIYWRFQDSHRRTSILQLTKFDFTVA